MRRIAMVLLLTAGSVAADTWRPLGFPPVAGGIFTGAADQSRLYARETWYGPWRSSTDAGRTWQPLSRVPPGLVLAFAVAPDDADVAGAVILGVGSATRLHVSEDGGSTWTSGSEIPRACPTPAHVPEMNDCSARALHIGAGDHQEILVASGSALQYWGAYWDYNPGWGALRSTDGGRTWEPSTYPQPEAYAFFSSDDGTFLYATNWLGLSASSDAGRTWRTAGFTGSGRGAVSPASPCNAVAPEHFGSFRVPHPEVQFSVDCGATWRRGEVPIRMREGVSAVAASRASPGTFLAALDGRLMRSTDGGATWRRPRGVPCSLASIVGIVRLDGPTERFLVLDWRNALWELTPGAPQPFPEACLTVTEYDEGFTPLR